MKKLVSTVSRRGFLAGTAGVLAAPMVTGLSRAVAASDSLTMAGGVLGEVTKRPWPSL